METGLVQILVKTHIHTYTYTQHAVMLSVVFLNVIMLSVVMQCVVMMKVMAPPLFNTIIKKCVVPLIPGLAPHSINLVTVLVPEMKRNKLDRFQKKTLYAKRRCEIFYISYV